MISLPSKPKVIFEEGNRAVFEIEDLYPGYGQTIGNSLRRVLFSSIPGAAITSVKIDGVQHEFSTIDGVMEDVVEIILNLKQFRFRLYEPGPFIISLSAKGEKKITGRDFKMPSLVELVNKDVHVATITFKKTGLSLEAVVESGFGYMPVEARTKEKVEIGTIAVDASFSPVRRVNYDVENMRIGDRTDYNRLKIDIETDGSITPREAFERAAQILVGQFQALGTGFLEQEKIVEPTERLAEKVPSKAPQMKESVFKIRLDELKFSARTLNALLEAGIKTVGGLARKKESALRETEGLGDKGIQEIKKALGNFGITLKQ